MTTIESSVDLLGKTVKDRITGFKGVVTSVSFDLYGCIQVVICPGKIDKSGKELPSFGWIDINRIEKVKGKPVMEHPNFDVKYAKIKDVHGPANKPL